MDHLLSATNMSFVAISSLLLLLSAVVASPAQPRPGGSLLRRDAVYPVHNPTDTCYPYEVLDNKGKSNQQYQPADTYPTVQGIIGGVPGGNYWENPYVSMSWKSPWVDQLIDADKVFYPGHASRLLNSTRHRV